ncbi:hypothetical protein AAFF_G00069080 [Aldrovandia affinis]|uniref:Uncharacterized protein n=1 Tax=Aldrovandia affinis TaxID=143900 RepID=A0AAD7RZ70_9TELE|nr:hypothetical protein AAFF_G00069080 [Aldrovandia affinis]
MWQTPLFRFSAFKEYEQHKVNDMNKTSSPPVVTESRGEKRQVKLFSTVDRGLFCFTSSSIGLKAQIVVLQESSVLCAHAPCLLPGVGSGNVTLEFLCGLCPSQT